MAMLDKLVDAVREETVRATCLVLMMPDPVAVAAAEAAVAAAFADMGCAPLQGDERGVEKAPN